MRKGIHLVAAFLLVVLFVSSCQSLPKHKKQGSSPVKKGTTPLKKKSTAQRVSETIDDEVGDCGEKQECVTTYSKFDLAIIMDQSGSTQPSQGTIWEEEKKFVKDLATDFQISEGGIHMGITRFASVADTPVKFTDFTDSESFKAEVDTFVHPGDGGTDFDRALLTAYQELLTAEGGMRADVSKIMLFISDGTTSSTSEAVKVEMDKVKKLGFQVYAIGVGKADREEMLKMIAGGNEDHLFMANDFGELKKKLYAQLTQTVCKSVVRDECAMKAKFDMGIIIDESGSMTDPVGGTTLYEQQKELLLKIAKDYPIQLGGVQMGVLKFSDSRNTHVAIKFNKHQDAASFENEVKEFSHPGGSRGTDMKTALEVARTQLFTPASGMRTEVPQVLIFITDGSITHNTVEETVQAVEQLRVAVPDLHIYAVGVKKADRGQLETVFANGNEHDVVTAKDFKGIMDTVYEELSQKICKDVAIAKKDKNKVEKIDVADKGVFTVVKNKKCTRFIEPKGLTKVVSSLRAAKDICKGMGIKCDGILAKANTTHTSYRFCALSSEQANPTQQDKGTGSVFTFTLHVHQSQYKRHDRQFCLPSEHFAKAWIPTLSEAMDACKIKKNCNAVMAYACKDRIGTRYCVRFQACLKTHNRRPSSPSFRVDTESYVYEADGI